jgi:hypothetical protein
MIVCLRTPGELSVGSATTATMTTTPPIIDEAETHVRVLAAELTRVREGECLCCYVARQLDEHGCDGRHGHSVRYRDAVAPRATALLERLSRLGACCCDCELFMNGYQPHEQPPPCAGVRRGSVRPCTNWVRVRGW